MRGVVMVLMAIDHVRVYAGVPAGGPTPGVFFTRWITHFVAPAFAFFAGTGAFFHGRKLGDLVALRKYLVTRGLILIALELTILRVSWTFNLDFANYNLAGVIWMLGWSMIALAALTKLSVRAITIAGFAIVLLQGAFSIPMHVMPVTIKGAVGWIFAFLYDGGVVNVGPGGPPVLILYVLVPWIGVMALGYVFGQLMARTEPERMKKVCVMIGVTATGLFIVGAGVRALTSGAGPEAPPLWVRMLNQQKYPASQLFLLMTLGPVIALLPLVDKARGAVRSVLLTFGKVPMWYYLLHIPLIHALAIGVSLIRTGSVNPWLFANHPLNPGPVPPDYRWSLALLYLVWAVAIALLYVPCRWYAARKATSPAPWMRYI
jgi:uncharacterized membrane protein